MQMTPLKKWLSLTLCTALMAVALFTAGCSDNKAADDSGTALSTTTSTSDVSSSASGNVLGEGETTFLFTVTDKEGGETQFEIHTDKTTVGAALLELGLIAGDDSEYGLYVKTVNGITADYDTDGTYWAFYINGEYAPTGVDSTNIAEGATYSFKVE